MYVLVTSEDYRNTNQLEGALSNRDRQLLRPTSPENTRNEQWGNGREEGEKRSRTKHEKSELKSHEAPDLLFCKA